MKTTHKITAAILPLAIGYAGTYAYQVNLGINQEASLIQSSDVQLPAALIGKDVLVSFDKMQKLYQDAAILGDSELSDAAIEEATSTKEGLAKLSIMEGLRGTRKTQINDVLVRLKTISPKAEAVYGQLAEGEFSDELMEQSKDLNERLTKMRLDLDELGKQLATDIQEQLSEVRSETAKSRQLSGILFVVVIFGSMTILFWVISNYIAKPLVAMVDRLKDIAQGEGDLTQRLAVNSNDEISELAKWFNSFLEKLQGIIAEVGDTTQDLTNNAGTLADTSQSMNSSAAKTSQQATMVAEAANDVSDNAQAAATGVDEMGISIKEIARSANDAAMVATSAVDVANKTNATVEKLGASSVDIGKIIAVITSIAEQTNLLALNATIEAARAGDSGKGFAVVANEVKELAKETANATDEISRKIQAIQLDADASMQAISQISEIIAQINDLQTSIAGAVEEQSAVMAEIGRSVGLAADGSSQIANNIMGVATAADETTDGANTTQKQAAALNDISRRLENLVGLFKYT